MTSTLLALALTVPLSLGALCLAPAAAQDAPTEEGRAGVTRPAGEGREGVTRPAEKDPHGQKGHQHGPGGISPAGSAGRGGSAAPS